MPEVTSHEPGRFSWWDLGTTDQARAKEFYAGFFGWGATDLPSGGGGVYTLFDLGGKDVAACYGLMPEMVAAGVPSHWGAYVTVASADATCARARDLGGSIVMEPFDVMDKGRMGVIRDPQGATFSVWEARAHAGSALTNEPGTAGWCELATTDAEDAKRFYSGLFGWSPRTSDGGDMPYTEWDLGECPAGGMLEMDARWGGAPPHWLTYFLVDDCDAAAEKAKSLSGEVVMPPMDIPNVGRFALLKDPTGAVFAVIKLAMP